MWDILIVGGGPAGLTAGIYGVRAGRRVLIIEEIFCGGLVNYTVDIENYPGFPGGIKGQELALRFYDHAKKLGCEFMEGKSVVGLEKREDLFSLKLSDGSAVEGRSVILSMGSKPKKLGIPGEDKFAGKGVSYCAVCDGSFFKNKKVAVVGGGNSAVQEAIYLSNIADRVFLIHRRDSLRADKTLQERLFGTKNIEFLPNHTVKELRGGNALESIVLEGKDGIKEMQMDGIFIYVGFQPRTDFLKGILELDDEGYIITDERMRTSMEGVFAAGDVRSKELRQIVTAVSDGAMAGFYASKYIEERFG